MEIRLVEEKDLFEILKLYQQLHNNKMPETTKELMLLWTQLLNDKHQFILVGVEDGLIVSSCVLIIIPNLTHNQQPYALIENVITHKDYRNRGYAKQLLNYAKELAIQNHCYKIMLMTSSKEEATLQFYEKAGFNQRDKTAFIQWL